MRKAAVAPSFEHYLNKLNPDDETLVIILKGHLVVEALLVELIQLRVADDSPWKWSFPTKTSKCVSLGFINEAQAEALNDLNDIRNDFAHILGNFLTFDSVFDLVRRAALAGFDFSDDTIYQDKILSEEWYGIEGGLIEVLNSFYFDLAMILIEKGGPNQTAG